MLAEVEGDMGVAMPGLITTRLIAQSICGRGEQIIFGLSIDDRFPVLDSRSSTS